MNVVGRNMKICKQYVKCQVYALIQLYLKCDINSDFYLLVECIFFILKDFLNVCPKKQQVGIFFPCSF